MSKVIIMCLLSIFLSACGTMSRNNMNVQDTKTVYITVPEHLTENCKVKKPMSNEEYIVLKPNEKEQYLTDYIIVLITAVKECNIKLGKIKQLNIDQK